jgi:hypothetical protein
MGIDPATFRFVAQCLSHCATPCPVLLRLLPQICLNVLDTDRNTLDNCSVCCFEIRTWDLSILTHDLQRLFQVSVTMLGKSRMRSCQMSGSIPYRRFGTDSLETLVRSYHQPLSNYPEERSSQPLRGGSLKSRRSEGAGIGWSKNVSNHYNINSGFDIFGIVCRLHHCVK